MLRMTSDQWVSRARSRGLNLPKVVDQDDSSEIFPALKWPRRGGRSSGSIPSDSHVLPSDRSRFSVRPPSGLWTTAHVNVPDFCGLRAASRARYCSPMHRRLRVAPSTLFVPMPPIEGTQFHTRYVPFDRLGHARRFPRDPMLSSGPDGPMRFNPRFVPCLPSSRAPQDNELEGAISGQRYDWGLS